MHRFRCPYLDAEVELTEERARHITDRHPDLLPEYLELIAGTLADPDQVRRSARFAGARLFSRRYSDIRDGKHVVVVVVSGQAIKERHWIITSYISRKLVEGGTEWKRN